MEATKNSLKRLRRSGHVIRARNGNKAKRDKASLYVDAKEALKIIYTALPDMPKIERIDGAPESLKQSVCNIIRNFYKAWHIRDRREEFIAEMAGELGMAETALEICSHRGFITDRRQEQIAWRFSRIEEGIEKWMNSQKPGSFQARAEVGAPQEFKSDTSEGVK